jgi:hypothetical protein
MVLEVSSLVAEGVLIEKDRLGLVHSGDFVGRAGGFGEIRLVPYKGLMRTMTVTFDCQRHRYSFWKCEGKSNCGVSEICSYRAPPLRFPGGSDLIQR